MPFRAYMLCGALLAATQGPQEIQRLTALRGLKEWLK